MILCIDTRALKSAPHIQKDVDLDTLLTDSVKYFDTVEAAEKERFVPLYFCTSVRTTYSNRVLQKKEGDSYLYYVSLKVNEQLEHKGLELPMYVSAIALSQYVNTYSPTFSEVMSYSAFLPIGLYYSDTEQSNPILYSFVVLKDEAVDAFEAFILNPDIEFVPIDTMNKRREGNLPVLLDSLINIKEEADDEE